MKRIFGSLVVALTVLAWGCASVGGRSYDGGPINATAGTTAGDGGVAGHAGDSGADAAGNAGGAGVDDPFQNGECHERDIYPGPKPVAVMLLLDMSESMTEILGDKSKWEHAREAITSLLTDPAYTDLAIHYGFDYYPNDTFIIHPTTGASVFGCSTNDQVTVDVAQGGEQPIIDWLKAAKPFGSTPLYCALNNFADPTYAPSFTGLEMEKYLVLISDGADACGWECYGGEFTTPAQLEDVTNRIYSDVGLDTGGYAIHTISIGFGNNTAPVELDVIARAGKVFKKHIDAADAEQLNQAFNTIANTVVSCVWDLKDDDALADPDKVNFYLDGGGMGDFEAIPFLFPSKRCATASGWIYRDENRSTVEFCNHACAAVRGGVQTISASFGCPSVQ
mgnify:CR=1 FL=1